MYTYYTQAKAAIEIDSTMILNWNEARYLVLLPRLLRLLGQVVFFSQYSAIKIIYFLN